VSASRLVTAVLFVGAISLLVHGYVWTRLVRDASWPPPWGNVGTGVVFGFAVLVPGSFFAIRFLPRSVHGPLAWVVYPWMGVLLYLFLLAIAGDLARLAAFAAGVLPADPDRRLFLSRWIAAGVGGIAGALGIAGGINVARGYVVRRVRVPLAKLAKEHSGYSIVQLTDVHIGPTLGREFLEGVVRTANDLAPDMVVITGDLVDGSVEELAHLVEPLSALKATDGVFFVTGNHEYYSGANEWIAHLRSLGIRVLRNERVAVRGAFELAGVDDESASRVLPGHGADVAKAVSGRDARIPLVLLAHQPKTLHAARAAGVDLQISGHVHGGQLVPFNWLARLDQPVVSGLERVDRTWIYVSMGTGYWGPPMRVGSGAEVTRIELVAG
jgi:predicted MPP superfamily phosphohydrolase